MLFAMILSQNRSTWNNIRWIEVPFEIQRIEATRQNLREKWPFGQGSVWRSASICIYYCTLSRPDITRERGFAFLRNTISLKHLVTLKQTWFGLKTWFLNDNTILFLFTIIEIHNKRFRIDSRQNRPRVGGDGQTTNKVILRFIKGKNFEEWNLNSLKFKKIRFESGNADFCGFRIDCLSSDI